MQPTDLDQDDVVISGVGGHFPECDNLEEFRDSLLAGKDLLTDNAERWKPGKNLSTIIRFRTTPSELHRLGQKTINQM